FQAQRPSPQGVHPMSCATIPPILASLIARITAAVPARARSTFLDLLLGAAASKGGHVTDAILASGLSRGWSTYYWFLEQGRWSWLRVWAALLEVLRMLFRPAVWYAVIDDSVVERVSTEAPGSLTHHNHNAKPNRPKFLRGQGWLCLAAVVERNDFAVGAVPLLLRLVRRGTNRGKLQVARYRTCLVAARFLRGRVVRAVWVELERPDRRDKPRQQRLLICTDPALSAPLVISAYAKRWAVESLFRNLKHGFGLKDAWQQSRQALMRWVTVLAVGYAIPQMLAFTDPARLAGLAQPAPWRAPGTRTAGLIQAGITRILREVGRSAFIAAIWEKIDAAASSTSGSSAPLADKAA